MTKLENFLQEHAIYAPNKVQTSPVDELLKEYDMKQISAGYFARVYKIKDKDWVIKEGRWDLDFDFFPGAKIPLPAALTERVLRLFSFTFRPDDDEILRQYKQYLNFIQYFGLFYNDKTYFHPNRELIYVAQQNVRNALMYHAPEIEKAYKVTLPKEKLQAVFKEIKYHNFLPKEYLLVGKSIAKRNKGRNTFYIFQEFVEGTHIHDIKDEKLSNDHKKQLILMMYLILLMHHQIKLVPDTRPRYPLLQGYNWITKTDNIIVSKKGLKFIDTRWLWEADRNFIKRGLIIPNLVLTLSSTYLKKLIKHV